LTIAHCSGALPLLHLDNGAGLAKPHTSADGPSPAPNAKAKERHMKKILISAAAVVASSNAALAHPGEHGFSVLNSLWHLLTEPDHLAMIGVAVVVAGALAYKHFRRAA
jgi:hypothetical protein